MSLNMFWFLPTHGDGHYLGTEEGSRPVDHGYLQQIAQAADRLANIDFFRHQTVFIKQICRLLL